jgi:cytochrome c biogenesis protein CcmG/thiol:disulfide interchange protein DsbE
MDSSDAPGEVAEDHGRIGYGRYARYTPLALALLLVAVLFLVGLSQRRPSAEPSGVGRLVGRPAPEATLTLLDGRPLRLADLRGSVVALNFWASWCAPCKAELPRFQALSEAWTRTGEPVTVVGVGIKRDYGEGARQLVADLGLTFPIGRDTAGEDELHGPIETAFGVSDYPTTVFIDPTGVVAAVHIGELDSEGIGRYVERARQG